MRHSQWVCRSHNLEPTLQISLCWLRGTGQALVHARTFRVMVLFPPAVAVVIDFVVQQEIPAQALE